MPEFITLIKLIHPFLMVFVILCLCAEFYGFYKRAKEEKRSLSLFNTTLMSAHSTNVLKTADLEAEITRLRGLVTDGNIKYQRLEDDLRDTINILAKQRPIDYEVYKLLVAECACDLCRDLFKDYLDFSEGLRTDISLTLSDDVLTFKEEATVRGNTVEVPTQETIAITLTPEEGK